MIDAGLAVAAALHAVRSTAPPLAEDGALDGHAELNLPDGAVAAPVSALAARVSAELEPPEDARVPLLKDLGVGDARVCHVRVHAALAGPRGSRAGAARDGLVVPEAVLVLARDRVLAARAKGQVVAAALAGGGRAEGPEHDVRDALRGQDVAADHGEAGPRVEDAALGDDDVDRRQAALVEGDLGRDEAAQAVDDGRVRDGHGRVGVAEDVRARAGEVKGRRAVAGGDGDLERDGRAVVHVVDRHERLRAEPGDRVPHQLAHGVFGRVLDRVHVPVHDAEAVLRDERLDQRDALGVGRDLRVEVREVVLQSPGARAALVPRGLLEEEATDLLLVETALAHQLRRLDRGTFLPERVRRRRHGARQDAANVRMVSSRGDVEGDFSPVKDGRDDGDVRQLVLVPHGELHGPQVHGDVGRVGDEAAVGAEDGTREVQTLFDVGRHGRLLQRPSHLLGDGHEAVAKHGELDGAELFLLAILLDADDDSSPFEVTVDDHVALEDRGGRGRGRAGDASADGYGLELVDGGVEVAAALEIDTVGRAGLGTARTRGASDGLHLGKGALLDLGASCAGGSNSYVVDDDGLFGEVEAEPAAVGFLKLRLEIPAGPLQDHEGAARPGISHVEIGVVGDEVLGEALLRQLQRGLRGEVLELLLDTALGLLGVGDGGRLLDLVDDVCKRHTIRREDGRVLVDDDARDAKDSRNGAGVLAAGTAEAGQVMGAGLVAAGFCQGTDGARHALVGDLQEAEGNFLGR
ncbi:hypothetical protein CTA1_6123 [Colletotrichum tanaceti]|uniref:Uncharacterized protein n=1 Tax=Colletotrichum tanaceti TaxID=1306861 RepID=A0A4U6X3P5_9PEZI|nr:hypothetical protein CTA1_6123 [Colletotrichum tanaceti]